VDRYLAAEFDVGMAAAPFLKVILSLSMETQP
jgi:hypothetical protein